jgi:hypothetical protein
MRSFLWHSVVEYLRMDSSKFELMNRFQTIQHHTQKEKNVLSVVPQSDQCLLVESKINFWEKNVFYRPFHKLNGMILLHLERILISSDCVSQHFINMKSSSWRLSRTMTKTILFSLLCTWLASWSLAADIETFVHWINKIYCNNYKYKKH